MGVFKLLLILTFLLLIIAFSIPAKPNNEAPAPAFSDEGICGTSKVIAYDQTLSDVAATCGTTVDELLSANPTIQDLNSLLPAGTRIMMPRIPSSSINPPQIPNTGSQVEIVITGIATSTPDPAGPPSITSYTVKPGDTISALAVQYNTTTDEIMKLNPSIGNPNHIYIGQVLVLP